MTPPRSLIVMGVSGSGKTTVGRELARRLGWDYADADDYHPPANVAKMRGGVPLDDADRRPWLERLGTVLREHLAANEPLVLACSALKRRYRELLGTGDPDLALVYLRGSPELIAARLRARTGHYFDPALLSSQFEALEEPDDALVVDVTAAPEELAGRILADLGLPAPPPGTAPEAGGGGRERDGGSPRAGAAPTRPSREESP